MRSITAFAALAALAAPAHGQNVKLPVNVRENFSITHVVRQDDHRFGAELPEIPRAHSLPAYTEANDLGAGTAGFVVIEDHTPRPDNQMADAPRKQTVLGVALRVPIGSRR